MKTHLRSLLLALVTISSTLHAADTPAAILADYRAKAEQATERLNKTLDTEAAKISATLLSLGDAPAVKKLSEQVKAKQAGEAVADTIPQAVSLFTGYDQARQTALAPATNSALNRIDSLLKSSAGQSIEIVADLAQIKSDIKLGKICELNSAPSPHWTFHRTRSGPSDGSVVFGLKGDITYISKIGNKSTGTWKRLKEDTIIATFPNDEWKIHFRKSGTEIESVTRATYYLQAVKP